jgi:hypothetical protein
MPGVIYLYTWEGGKHYMYSITCRSVGVHTQLSILLPFIADSRQENDEIASTESSASGDPTHSTARTGNLHTGMKSVG